MKEKKNVNWLYCKNCDFLVNLENYPDAMYCGQDGSLLEGSCHLCNRPISNPFDNFCIYCGEPFNRNKSLLKKHDL